MLHALSSRAGSRDCLKERLAAVAQDIRQQRAYIFEEPFDSSVDWSSTFEGLPWTFCRGTKAFRGVDACIGRNCRENMGVSVPEAIRLHPMRGEQRPRSLQ
ncbi:hypothetical protein CB0940_07087 [Cercospora beticola]|uniref:Uncharacterized protein n=1 Tax=Cercospora beticola TaxID=122368 RepID=A0A2G5H9S9_CERBT|nr:hypothetical protein CB0940_07087 [Cercospora beticola]PIA89284.1 hypothetical protein CB0940_07087 [Cercospora beticola]